jgi:prepilin signal peptidase PulO-like enzyme (type II secretory pathway)
LAPPDGGVYNGEIGEETMTHVKDTLRPLFARHAYRHTHLPSDGAREFDWGAAGWAGVIAGVLYILADSTMVALFTHDSSSALVRRIAAIALGGPSESPSPQFTQLVFFAATVVHLPLSLLYARIIAAVVQRLDAARATACGAALGAGIYVMNYYGFTHLFPWFATGRGAITLVSHVLFGAVAAWIYIAETHAKKRRIGGN